MFPCKLPLESLWINTSIILLRAMVLQKGLLGTCHYHFAYFLNVPLQIKIKVVDISLRFTSYSRYAIGYGRITMSISTLRGKSTIINGHLRGLC